MTAKLRYCHSSAAAKFKMEEQGREFDGHFESMVLIAGNRGYLELKIYNVLDFLRMTFLLENSF